MNLAATLHYICAYQPLANVCSRLTPSNNIEVLEPGGVLVFSCCQGHEELKSFADCPAEYGDEKILKQSGDYSAQHLEEQKVKNNNLKCAFQTNKLNILKNRNWQKADQLAVYKAWWS